MGQASSRFFSWVDDRCLFLRGGVWEMELKCVIEGEDRECVYHVCGLLNIGGVLIILAWTGAIACSAVTSNVCRLLIHMGTKVFAQHPKGCW